jgi:hypothetical protein
MSNPLDIIDHSINNKAVDVQKSVADIMLDKVRDAIEAKKVEVAQNFFGLGRPPAEEPYFSDDPDEPTDLDDDIDDDISDEQWDDEEGDLEGEFELDDELPAEDNNDPQDN